MHGHYNHKNTVKPFCSFPPRTRKKDIDRVFSLDCVDCRSAPLAVCFFGALMPSMVKIIVVGPLPILYSSKKSAE